VPCFFKGRIELPIRSAERESAFELKAAGKQVTILGFEHEAREAPAFGPAFGLANQRPADAPSAKGRGNGQILDEAKAVSVGAQANPPSAAPGLVKEEDGSPGWLFSPGSSKSSSSRRQLPSSRRQAPADE
jgi:hypothetical protein